MTPFRTFPVLVALAASATALADADCSDPLKDWKPREALRQHVALRGWMVQRIKIDDGCYEFRGTDRLGNKVKARYAPATLRIRSLEVEFGPDGDASDYLPPLRPPARGHGTASGTRKGNKP